MKATVLLHAGAASQLLPLAAAAAWRRRPSAARTWVLVWCGILVAGDALALLIGHGNHSNLIVVNLIPPLASAVVLWALSLWQTGEVSRLAIRIAIPGFLVAWTLLTVAFNEIWTFSSMADPLCNLVGLGAATITLLARSHTAEGALHRHDWLWVCGGMALYFGAAAAQGPLSALLVGQSPSLLVHAYEVKSVLDILAFLAIARGVTCPPAT